MHREILAQWRDGDMSPSLLSDSLDIWRIDLEQSTSGQRSQAHDARRIILAAYLGVDADTVTLTTAPGGKPHLAEPDVSLEFNLSHTRGIALLAVHACHAVGVDIERRRSIDDPIRLARRVMPAAQIDLLQAAPTSKRATLFLDLWTRFEAQQKALGRGLFAPHADPDKLFSFAFSAGEDLHACVALACQDQLPSLRFFDFRRQ